ncbi:MAG: polyprenyl synthetase family protein, partial [Arcobacter sp.]|nr:polyprenyl synthetase family protein [Arcobacter sp.]
KLCAIVEMIHAASLLHDDVIDEATTRRGQQTINSIFGNITSIMFGDILYSKAFTELTKMPQDVAYAISNAVTLLSVGELLDVELSKTFNTSYDKYLDMIYKKTASLIEASASSAASLAGKNIENFANYGRNLGLAFQMIDDILDITEDSAKLGKPSMLDFVEGKVTIPYLLLFERIDESEKLQLETLYKKELSDDELMWIKEKMNATLAIADSIDMAKKFGFEAINAIKNEQNEELVGIMKAMIERDF